MTLNARATTTHLPAISAPPARLDSTSLQVLLVTLAFCSSSGAIQGSLALYLESEAFGFDAIGLAGAVFAGGILVGTVLASRITRTQRVLLALMASCASLALVAGGYLLQAGLLLVLLVRMLEGLAYGAFLVTSEAVLLGQSDEKNNESAAARYAIATALGHVIGPALAGLGIILFARQAPFAVAAMLGILAAVVSARAWWTLRKAQSGDAPDGQPAKGGFLTSPMSALSEESLARAQGSTTLRPRLVLDLCLSTATFGFVYSGLLVVLPPMLVSDRGWSSGQATAGVALVALGVALIAVPAVHLARRIGHGWVLSLFGLCIALLLALLVSLPASVADLAIVIGLGFAMGGLSPVCLDALRLRLLGKGLLQGTAAYNGCYALGLLAGAPITGLVATAHGLATAVSVAALPALAMTISVALLQIVHRLDARKP